MAGCILCGTGAVVSRQDSGSRTIYNCPVCGVFVVSDLAVTEVKKESCKIAAFMAGRHLAKLEDTVLISYDNAKQDKDYIQLTVAQIVSQFPRSYTEIVDRILINLTNLSSYPGAEIKVEDLDMSPYFYLTRVNYDALSYAIKSLQNAELCDVSFYNSAFFPCGLVVSPKGWDRVSNLQNAGDQHRNALLVFARTDDAWSATMRMAARKAVEDCGLSSTESSSFSLDNKIGYALMAQIKNSKFIVCDLSNGFSAGYYAAAMAQTLGKAVALTCHESQKHMLKINTDEISVFLWKDKKDLYRILYNMIRATVP